MALFCRWPSAAENITPHVSHLSPQTQTSLSVLYLTHKTLKR
ncbi:hypothetical protein OIU84_020473 [Salix udensis]|uniref:Uncharacterized protein n=1 Tax=Salix udensis TaxID=889485 RepID=A0AAD6KSD6_9ROSI|nr:hypothetical protein OIU84_020473 [Salix udensis]